jgi:hypothetical protein
VLWVGRIDSGNIAMTAVGMEPLLYQCLALEGNEDEGTVIVDPRGTVLAKTGNHHEDTASIRLPIADSHKTRRMPELSIALFRPVLAQYGPLLQPNALLGKLPETCKEAGDLVRKRLQGG